MYESDEKIPEDIGGCILCTHRLDWYYTKTEEVNIMDLRELLDQARDAGVFTTITVPVSTVRDADRTVDFGTEDAYAHMSELA